MLYYDEDDDKGYTVINYLVQSEFPSYQSSLFLNINIGNYNILIFNADLVVFAVVYITHFEINNK